MKKAIALLVLIGILFPASAQRLGVLAGYSLTNASPSIDLSSSPVLFKSAPTSGFVAGPIFAWNFHKYVGADIAVMANMRGASLTVNQNNRAIVYKRTSYYLNIPLHAYYRQQIKNAELTVFLGPSFNVGMDGSDYAYQDTETQRPLFDSKIDEKNIFGKDKMLKRFEIALELGIGVEYKNVLFRTSYQYGLNNISNNIGYPYGLESVGSGIKEVYRQGVFSFTVGYMFDLGKKNKTYSK